MMQALPPSEPQVEIVVTGTALAAPRSHRTLHVERVSGRDLRAAAPQPLDRLLDRLGGVQQFRRSDSGSAHPTSQGITLRALGGNAASRALVLLDGVPQSDPFGGWISWPSIGTLSLEEARLLRGGGSVTAGPGALAGTLELSSSTSPTMAATVEVGSRSSADGEALLSRRFGKHLVAVSLRGSRSDGFIPVASARRGEADRPAPFSTGAARLRWTAAIGADADLQAMLATFSDSRERGLAFTSNRTRGTDLSLRFVSRAALPLSLLVYAQDRDFRSSFASADAARQTVRRTSLQYDVPGSAVGWSAELRPAVGRALELRLGTDGRRMTGESREFGSYVAGQPTRDRVSGGQQSYAGLFAELTGTTGAITVTGAARVDRWRIFGGKLEDRNLLSGFLVTNDRFASRSGWRPTGRFGAAYALNGAVALRAAVYAGWRQPTLNELFRPFRAGSDATAANPLLRPERSRGADAGLDWRAGAWNASATAFVNRLLDPIANVTLGTGPGSFPGVGFVGAGGAYRQRQNLPAIRSRGLELSGGWVHGPWQASLSASLTDARVSGSGVAAPLNHLRPAQTPRASGSLRGAWRDQGRWAEVAVHYESSRYEDDLNRLRLPSSVTADVAGALPLTRFLSLTARAENLFNKEALAGLSADGIAERATPRTVWLGLTFGTHRP